MSLVSFITLTAVPRIAQARRGFGSEKPGKFSKAFGLGMAGGLASIKPRVFPEDPLCAARSRSRPVRENQLDKAGNPVGRKSLIADFVLSGLLPSRCVPQESSLPYRHSQRSKPMLFLPASLLRGGRLARGGISLRLCFFLFYLDARDAARTKTT